MPVWGCASSFLCARASLAALLFSLLDKQCRAAGLGLSGGREGGAGAGLWVFFCRKMHLFSSLALFR